METTHSSSEPLHPIEPRRLPVEQHEVAGADKGIQRLIDDARALLKREGLGDEQAGALIPELVTLLHSELAKTDGSTAGHLRSIAYSWAAQKNPKHILPKPDSKEAVKKPDQQAA